MKEISLAMRLKKMKPGDIFTVTGEPQRQRVCRIAKALRDSEAITHQIVTLHAGKNLFKVAAI